MNLNLFKRGECNMSNMSADLIISLIKERKSVRRFKPDPVSPETIKKLLEAARQAPNAGNLQPWYFIVVNNLEIRQQLVRAALNQTFLAEAPVNIVVCAEPNRSAARYGQRGRDLYCIQDTAAAVENILLTATAYGLGSCWVGAFNEQEVAQILKLKPEYRPVAIIPIGHPARETKTVARRPLEEVMHVID
jgi:nitroreductase